MKDFASNNFIAIEMYELIVILQRQRRKKCLLNLYQLTMFVKVIL